MSKEESVVSKRERTVNRVVHMLMNPYNQEDISCSEGGYVYTNKRLEEKIVKGELKTEHVGIQLAGGARWYFANKTRKEGYYLNPDSTTPLPTEINEKRYVKALNLLDSVLRGACVNIIITKEPGTQKYKIAYLMIVKRNKVWVF